VHSHICISPSTIMASAYWLAEEAANNSTGGHGSRFVDSGYRSLTNVKAKESEEPGEGGFDVYVQVSSYTDR
jgi:hypothetical protein